jgi:ribose-phosphate pyrophosphokinase
MTVVEWYNRHKQQTFEFEKYDLYVIAPDNGALKRAYKAANLIGAKVIECSKERDLSTGKIHRAKINWSSFSGSKKPYFLIVDDICDGGATFLELAEQIRTVFPDNHQKLDLCVTHGIFSKGVHALMGEFNYVITTNSYSQAEFGNRLWVLNVQ